MPLHSLQPVRVHASKYLTPVASPRSSTGSFKVPPRPHGSKSDIDMSIFNDFDLTPECMQSITLILPHLADISRSAEGGSCIPAAEESFDVDEDDWTSKSNMPLGEVGLYFFITTLGFSGFGVIM